jgi:aspartate dehydrogenase
MVRAPTAPVRFALIGLGAIGGTIARMARATDAAVCVGALVRRRPADAGGGLPIATDLATLLSLGPDLVVDCAGHGALAANGEAILAAGCDLLTVSSGALADPGLEGRLRQAAARHRRRIVIPAGAIAGIDALAAARHGGLTHVAYTGTKPVRAWRGTPAEGVVDLDRLDAPAVFFTGSARQAARLYPANANVTATVALAGLGFDATEVRLIADPAATGNIHQLAFEGTFGRAEVRTLGRPSPENPRTSILAALSVWQAIISESGGIVHH